MNLGIILWLIPLGLVTPNPCRNYASRKDSDFFPSYWDFGVLSSESHFAAFTSLFFWPALVLALAADADSYTSLADRLDKDPVFVFATCQAEPGLTRQDMLCSEIVARGFLPDAGGVRANRLS